jgi:hypothetical protein
MRVRRRASLFAMATALVALACGGCEVEAPGEAEVAAVSAAPIGGLYEVSGVTVDKRTGGEREISGKIILAERGDRYTATFSLSTTYPGESEPMPADVIGKGEGAIDGRTLTGTAETQLVMATIPGIDPGFAFVPRQVSTRLLSNSVTTIRADGSATIEIENEPAPGQTYAPTRTTLRGRRVSAAALGDD